MARVNAVKALEQLDNQEVSAGPLRHAEYDQNGQTDQAHNNYRHVIATNHIAVSTSQPEFLDAGSPKGIVPAVHDGTVSCSGDVASPIHCTKPAGDPLIVRMRRPPQ